MNDPAPAQVFSLASYLCEEMEARGWNTDDVARRMDENGFDHDALTLLLILSLSNKNLAINDETFRGLSRAFGVSAQTFKNLHQSWLDWPDRQENFDMPDCIVGPDCASGFPRHN